MKKAILIIVFGLLLSGCASSEYADFPYSKIMLKDENLIHVAVKVGGQDNAFKIAAKHCKAHDKFTFRVSSNIFTMDNLKRQYANSIPMGHIALEYICSNEKIEVAPSFATGAGRELWTDNYEEDPSIKIKRDITFTINDKKEQCEAIGFEPQTEKFADCVLRLVELDVKSQQQAQIQLAISQGNQQVADELRAQRNQQGGQYLMDLGQKLLNPPTKKTTRCTVTGIGSFKTVTCR